MELTKIIYNAKTKKTSIIKATLTAEEEIDFKKEQDAAALEIQNEKLYIEFLEEKENEKITEFDEWKRNKEIVK